MVREILIYPDPVLFKKSNSPTMDKSDDRKVTELTNDLIDTLANANGVAIAAIQVGVTLRVMVLNHGMYYQQMISPTWMAVGDLVDGEEGCLSVPGVRENVKRFDRILVSYWVLNGDNLENKTEELTGLLARAVQHEVEHMDGGIFLNNMPIHKRDSAKQKMKKLHREAKKAGVSAGEYVYGNSGGWIMTRKE
jgi:peptide deformylase